MEGISPFIQGTRADDRKEQSVYTKEAECGMGCNGSFVGRKRSGGWEVTDRLYGAVGEKSIDFLKILYRLFSDTSVHSLGQYGSNDLIVWDNRSVPIVQPLCFLRRKEC